jgi:hypothetical protein
MSVPGSDAEGFAWIDAMTDAECMEVFWLYVDPPEPFLARHSPQLLGAAMRRVLREVAQTHGVRREARVREESGS